MRNTTRWFQWFINGGKMKFLLLLIAFIAIYLAFRMPWMSSDPGIPSVWEYGYNSTDEGYYLSGGKEKLLWGHFVDLPRSEAFTYGFSAGTHWLSYLAHLCFGLSTWTWRIPFFCVYLIGWLLMFVHVSKRAGAVAAFTLCTSVSLIPMVVAYERTASNDALISALLLISYVCIAGRTRLRTVLAGVISGAIVLVKPSVWILLPIVASGVVEERKFSSAIKYLVLYLIVAVASVFLWKLLVALSVMPDAAYAGTSIWEIVKKTTTHYPLPSIFDFASHFKGFSAFPRDPSIQLLGVAAPIMFSMPFCVAAKMVAVRRWNGHLLLCVSLLAYVAAVSVMNTIYTHYFLPVVIILPIAISSMSFELEELSQGLNKATWRKSAVPILLTVALCIIASIMIDSLSKNPSVVQNYYSRVYNLPMKNVWGMVWPMILIFASLITLGAAISWKVKNWSMITASALSAAVAASVAFAALPAVQLSVYIKKDTAEYFAPMIMSLGVSALFLVFVFVVRERFPWRKIAVFAVPLCMVACCSLTPNWRKSFNELLQPGGCLHKNAAKELSSLLPSDAIVIGERSNQMLMSLPIRTATTFPSNSDPIPIIESILKSEPNAKLYALADSQHAYNLQHYRKHENKYRLRHIRTLKMPSFGDGRLADVYLCEIVVADRK
jgi:4-amino-4-deoxy-L-arabinose transferase-like glycosyltransferase